MENCILKRGILFALILCLIPSAVGCGMVSSGAVLPEKAENGLTLIDQANRTVWLEKPAQTIVSGCYAVTCAAVVLKIQDRLAGIEDGAGHQRFYRLAAPELLEKPQIGGNPEAIAALHPDLVLLPKEMANQAETLTEQGIAVLIVNPESQENLLSMLDLIAQSCGIRQQAESILNYYGQQLRAAAAMSARAKMPRVYFAGTSSYLTAAAGKSYAADMISLAGGKNVTEKEKGGPWVSISYDELLWYDPEVIILPGAAEYSSAEIFQDKKLASVSAVRNQAVYQMPQSPECWETPGPAGILATLWLTSILHGDVYPFDFFQKDAVQFYSIFYGLELEPCGITR